MHGGSSFRDLANEISDLMKRAFFNQIPWLELAMLATCLLGAERGTAQNHLPSAASHRDIVSTIEQNNPSRVGREVDGTVVRLLVPFEITSDASLAEIVGYTSLTNLSLRFTDDSYTNLTATGFNHLRRLPYLYNLDVGCARTIPSDRFASICQLTNVKSLRLNFCEPPASSILLLTNLMRLEQLTILELPVFGDAELQKLHALPSLRRIILRRTSVSREGLKFLPQFPSLTNAIIIQALPGGGTTNLTWSKP